MQGDDRPMTTREATHFAEQLEWLAVVAERDELRIKVRRLTATVLLLSRANTELREALAKGAAPRCRPRRNRSSTRPRASRSGKRPKSKS